MAVLGMRSTEDLVDGERPLEWRLGISELYPNAIPLVTLIYRIGKKQSSDPEFNWFERSYPTREMTLDASDIPGQVAVGTADTLGLASGAYNARKFHVLINTRTLEEFLVTADPSSDVALAIKRGMGATGNAPAMLENDTVQVIGTAHEEGEDLPTAISYDVTKEFNYCEIFRNGTSNTRTALKTRLRTRALRQRAQREALLLHETEKEWRFLFGKPWEDTSGDEIKRGTGGLLHYATTHVKDFSGSVTLATWRAYIYDIFQDGSDEKILLAGNGLLETLEAMCDSGSTHMIDVPSTDTFGLNMRKWVGAGGTLYIQEEKLFSKSAAFYDWGVVVDPDRITYKYVDDTTWLPNRQGPGQDRNAGEYLAECGCEFLNAADTMGVIKNGTAFA
jgi:hypothetical protein